MEDNLHKDASKTSNKLHGKLVIFVVLALFIGAGIGYFAHTIISKPIEQEDEIIRRAQERDSIIQNADYVDRFDTYGMADDHEGKSVIFMIVHGQADWDANPPTAFSTLYRAEESRGANSPLDVLDFKSVMSLDDIAIGFDSPVIIKDDYFLVEYSGGGHYFDFMILDVEGNIITKSVFKQNAALQKWLISIKTDEIVEENRVKIGLFQINDTHGEAEIDLATGNVVPGTYKELGPIHPTQ